MDKGKNCKEIKQSEDEQIQNKYNDGINIYIILDFPINTLNPKRVIEFFAAMAGMDMPVSQNDTSLSNSEELDKKKYSCRPRIFSDLVKCDDPTFLTIANNLGHCKIYADGLEAGPVMTKWKD